VQEDSRPLACGCWAGRGRGGQVAGRALIGDGAHIRLP
jgi:hypothetical protein